MSGYAALAAFYDRLTDDVEYDRRAARLLTLFERHRTRPTSLLDLACGTGSLTCRLADAGIDMIGVDGSADMLAVAMERAADRGQELLFLEQDMRELDLYGTVEGAVCILDGLCHLTNTADIKETLHRLSLFIEPGGLLIFDVNTPYKHREILGDNSFVLEQEDFICVWRNRLIERTCEVEQVLDFFVEQEPDFYERLTDVVRERAYSTRTWERLLAESDFEVVAVYDDLSDNAPSPTTQRQLWVARNITKNYEN
ncbi:MAG: class I SAM-dependent methyltransferase [Clostridia bacterium]|nr:class I SAM-dependent methyltransferase [Clostridia bacterium]